MQTAAEAGEWTDGAEEDPRGHMPFDRVEDAIQDIREYFRLGAGQ